MWPNPGTSKFLAIFTDLADISEAQDVYGSWKVIEFKIQIFQAWKVMELGLGPGKSWKINQMVAAFLTRVRVFGLYMHYHCSLSDSVRSVVQYNYELCYIFSVL